MSDRNSRSDKLKEKTNNGPTRRGTLATVGSLTVLGVRATIPGMAAPEDYKISRVKGSSDSDLSFEETQRIREQVIDRHPHTDDSQLNDIAKPEFSEDAKMVEYIVRVDQDGNVSQFFGAATEGKEARAHRRGKMKERMFEEQMEQEISITSTTTSDGDSTPTDYGGDWDFVLEDQMSEDSTLGSVINNFEWYRIRDDPSNAEPEERNGIRSRAATAPDDGIATINFTVDHEWSAGELKNRDIHDADPSTTSSGSMDVGIGTNLDSLQWSFSTNNGVTQDLDNNGPDIEWSQSDMGGGTHWLHPGSHVVSDLVDCQRHDVIQIPVYAEWLGGGGAPYDDADCSWTLWTDRC